MHDRDVARQALVDAVERAGGADPFVTFLNAAGYEEVVEAIPAIDPKVHVEELVLALDRRHLLESGFFEACRQHDFLGAEVAQLAPEFGIALAEPKPRLQEHVPGPDDPLPPSVIDAIVAALANTGLDTPKVLDEIALGSEYRADLRPEPEPTSTSTALTRLAAQTDPHATEAAHWLVEQLFNFAPADSALARATSDALPYRDVGSETGDGLLAALQTPAIRQLVTDDQDILPIRFLSGGLDAGRSVVSVRPLDTSNDRQAAASSGWLLSPSLVVAPAHLFVWPAPAAGSVRRSPAGWPTSTRGCCARASTEA